MGNAIRRMADVSPCPAAAWSRRSRYQTATITARTAQADPVGGIMTNAIISLRPAPLTEDTRCSNQPGLPGAQAPDHIAARLIVRHPKQGWSMLYNLVVPSGNGGQGADARGNQCAPDRGVRRGGVEADDHRPGDGRRGGMAEP